MSSLSFLLTDLQSLSTETRRKYPDVRDASDKALSLLRSAGVESYQIASGDLLKPIFMGCATKNAKVIAIALGSLHRLISMKAVPISSVPQIITTMGDAMSQGVDIQLRILQTLLSLITNFPSVHGDKLSEALLLCFKLHESKIAVVSSTAAATLRQLVMFVVDKMQTATEGADIQVKLPDGTTQAMSPASRDAYSVFEDLCLLANTEKPNFLKLDYLHKTFALELIESVLTNYHPLFRTHAELILLLRHHLCPLLIKSLSDRPIFPLTLRCTRVVFLLLKQFSIELETESEVFLVLLIRIINDDDSDHPYQRPGWIRVLAMEIVRGLCNDAELMKGLWERYDSQPAGANVFGTLISGLKRLVSEKPSLLGVSSQMQGITDFASSSGDSGVPASNSGGSVAGMVVSAASAAANIILPTGPGLSISSSAMKIQCIDQLDKADSPPIPEAYLYLLAVQALVVLADGFAVLAQTQSFTASSSLKEKESVTKMLEATWPPLLASLSTLLPTNLSPELFSAILSSFENLITTAGILGLETPRDALLASLAKFAVPSRVVSGLSTIPETPRSASFSENLGLALSSSRPADFGLSERNLACLQTYLSSAIFLSSRVRLGEDCWVDIIETVQNAHWVLSSTPAFVTNPPSSMFSPRGMVSPPPKRTPSVSTVPGGNIMSAGNTPSTTAPEDESMLGRVQKLFEHTTQMSDEAFVEFVRALGRVSAGMVGLITSSLPQSTSSASLAVSRSGSISEGLADVAEEHVEGEGLVDGSLKAEPIPGHRRRVSGIGISVHPRVLKSTVGGGGNDFGITQLGLVALLNMPRICSSSSADEKETPSSGPGPGWTEITNHLISVLRHIPVAAGIRIQATRVLDEILVNVPRHLPPASTSSSVDTLGEGMKRLLSVLSQQILPSPDSSTAVEIRKMGLETLHQILESSGFGLVGWDMVFDMLGSVCGAPSSLLRLERSLSGDTIAASAAQSPSSSPLARPKPLSLGIGAPPAASERNSGNLIKIAFGSLTLICDSYISHLSPPDLKLCIRTLGLFGKTPDTNIALTAAASLLWSVSDSIQTKRKTKEGEEAFHDIWMFLLLESLGLTTDNRSEVRDGAIQTIFRTMMLYGPTLGEEMWEECIWGVVFPLLDTLTSIPQSDEESAASKWDESKTLALQSLGSLYHDFLAMKVIHLTRFEESWERFVGVIEGCCIDDVAVAIPALRCLEKAVRVSLNAKDTKHSRVVSIGERTWGAIEKIGDVIVERKGPKPFSQESLVAFLNVVQSTRGMQLALFRTEWELVRLRKLLEILKGVLTYPNSLDYRPDNDALPPVQSLVVDIITGIDLKVPGSPSLVMRDLAEFATLAFLAAFDVPADPKSQTPPKRVTYIALAKKTMPMLVEHFLRFKDERGIYVDETLEAVLSTYSIPIKLKYDCPPPSKFGKDLPLWKTATTCFLKTVKECAAGISILGQAIPAERIAGIWRQIIDVFRGGILADCSTAEALSLDAQEAEENFDRSLISSIESDVVPHLGDERVPDTVVSQLAKVLAQGSRLYDSSPHDSPNFAHSTSPVRLSYLSSELQEFVKVDVDYHYKHGSTDHGAILPREQFSYWCFDTLFHICSNAMKEQEHSRRRLAVLSLPALLNRCRSSLVGYVADESLRGNLPFPRTREDELLYILRKLLELKLWSGSLWAALSSDPTGNCISQPPVELSPNPSSLIADAVKRSSIAHLFHFYPVLCEIASIPRRTPSTWVMLQNGEAEELDARVLARNCLKEVGKEMGVST